MFDPILRLALSIHTSKGVDALVVGSGVSRSSQSRLDGRSSSI
jgi:hypothetical protein